MSRFNKGLKVGDVVQNGDKIGYVGSTGISTGPHLHFEVWVDGKRVRPSSVKLPSKALSNSEAELLRTYLKPTGKPAKTIQL
jgi:murein DD-endopeptidase MepM/ murein hydrolase activator NlpD